MRCRRLQDLLVLQGTTKSTRKKSQEFLGFLTFLYLERIPFVMGLTLSVRMKECIRMSYWKNDMVISIAWPRDMAQPMNIRVLFSPSDILTNPFILTLTVLTHMLIACVWSRDMAQPVSIRVSFFHSATLTHFIITLIVNPIINTRYLPEN